MLMGTLLPATVTLCTSPQVMALSKSAVAALYKLGLHARDACHGLPKDAELEGCAQRDQRTGGGRVVDGLVEGNAPLALA
jgi:hypothetical protein